MELEELIRRIDEDAKDIHKYQGYLLEVFEGEQYSYVESYIKFKVNVLSKIYCENFASIYSIEDNNDRANYAIAPLVSNGKYTGYAPPFEVEWLMKGLLGISLARQAVIIHQKPRGVEPDNASMRILNIVKEYLVKSNPNCIYEIIKGKGKVEGEER